MKTLQRVTLDELTAADICRAAADLIDAHPDLPAPFVAPAHRALSWHLWPWEYTDAQATARDIRRTIGGTWDKSYSGEDLVLRRDHAGITYTITVKREAVCTRRVVGTETVTLPAQAALPERTVEREVIEWDCDPILAEAAS